VVAARKVLVTSLSIHHGGEGTSHNVAVRFYTRSRGRADGSERGVTQALHTLRQGQWSKPLHTELLALHGSCHRWHHAKLSLSKPLLLRAGTVGLFVVTSDFRRLCTRAPRESKSEAYRDDALTVVPGFKTLRVAESERLHADTPASMSVHVGYTLADGGC
jgi:hypothetical protein